MNPVYIVYHQPKTFARQSAFNALAPVLGAHAITHGVAWEALQDRSWTLGHLLRRAGQRYYGSEWNALVPGIDELRIAGAIPRGQSIVHFLWGEFASPRWPGLFRRKGAVLAGTFHCSARRQPKVLGKFRCWRSFEWFSVVSESQIPYMVAQGVPRERIRFLPLGMDTEHFRPDDSRLPPGGRPLQAILVGQTERDHEFAAELMRRMPPGLLELQVCTAADYHSLYREVKGVRLLPRLGDEELLRLYQGAELMLMPMLDCTANDAMLEAMACGTPVMTNRVGGIPEYVDARANMVMEGKDSGEWVERIRGLTADRAGLRQRRIAVRLAAERFSWRAVAEQYRAFYRDVAGERTH
jgi:glycosyltransferase involved in cell wall biosynthesis